MLNNLINTINYQALNGELKIPSIQQSLFLDECQREIRMIRDDLIHSIISGNKWRKLNHHLNYFSMQDYFCIASMGGCFSNHLHALAYVCNQLGIPCTLFIYGWNGELNSQTLEDCKNWNAHLKPITREQAASLRIKGFQGIDENIQSHYWIPEGGGGMLGELGMKELIGELPYDFDQNNNLIICASGTGTSVQGLLNYTFKCQIATQQIVKMANYAWLNDDRIHLMPSIEKHSFAKREHRLMDFIEYFEKKYGILLDAVYTAPLMFSFLQHQELHTYDKIYFIHTGGLQGNR